MPPLPQTQQRQSLGVTEGPFSKLKVLNLTGKFIYLSARTLNPDGPEYTHKETKVAVHKVGELEITYYRYVLNPLPEPEEHTIILLNEHVAKFFPSRSDVYYPVESKTARYHTGSPMLYTGIARLVSDAEARAFEPTDGF